MATYKDIHDYVKQKTGVTIKDCWIAHVKEMLNLPRKQAPNRKDPNKRVHPCPDEHIAKIKEAFRYFKWI